MITYERHLPGKVAIYYDWRRRDYAQYIAYDLGAKPIVVRPDDYDAQLRAEGLPGSRPHKPSRMAGRPLVADLIEQVLTENESMMIFELARAIGRDAMGVSKALNRDKRFMRAGYRKIGTQKYGLWALRDEGSGGHD